MGADQPDHLPPHRPRRRGHRRRPPRPHRPTTRTVQTRPALPRRLRPGGLRRRRRHRPQGPDHVRAGGRPPHPAPGRGHPGRRRRDLPGHPRRGPPRRGRPAARPQRGRHPPRTHRARVRRPHCRRRQQRRAVDPGTGVPVRQRAHQTRPRRGRRRTRRRHPRRRPPLGRQHRRPARGHPDRPHPRRDRRPPRRVLDRAPTIVQQFLREILEDPNVDGRAPRRLDLGRARRPAQRAGHLAPTAPSGCRPARSSARCWSNDRSASPTRSSRRQPRPEPHRDRCRAGESRRDRRDSSPTGSGPTPTGPPGWRATTTTRSTRSCCAPTTARRCSCPA